MKQARGRNLFIELNNVLFYKSQLMSIQHCQIRLPKWKSIWMSFAIIITSLVIVQSWGMFRNFYGDLLFFSGAIAWLPVLLSYAFSLFIKKK